MKEKGEEKFQIEGFGTQMYICFCLSVIFFCQETTKQKNFKIVILSTNYVVSVSDSWPV